MMRRMRSAVWLLVGLAGACAVDGPSETPPAPTDGQPASARPRASDTNLSDGSAATYADAGDDAAEQDASSLPSPTNGVLDGTETDVDCGGPDLTTPRCKLYATCLASSDCGEGTCIAGPVGARCQLAPSCTGASGTKTCGLSGNEDCCTSLPVPDGTVQRYGIWTNTDIHPTHVSAYRLDKFEITVGRMRAFFQAKGGNLQAGAPAPGAGAHPKIRNSGWRSSFDVRLPASWSEINARLGKAGCTVGGDNSDGGTATWTENPGPYEELPITCADWYTLFAFCIWDGGRLPTDAEWLHAARGGDESRHYAWGPYEPLTWTQHRDVVVTTLQEPSDGTWRFTQGTPFAMTDADGHVIDGPAHIGRPGTKTGNGRWGHADLTGNVLEYMLDVAPVPEETCTTDCANVAFPDPPQDQIGLYPRDWRYGDELDPAVVYPDGLRSLRGGSFDIHPLETSYYYAYRLARTYGAAGARCARD